MVRSRDAAMYLLAIKSVYRFIGEGGVCAILDRGAPPRVHELLRAHVPGLEIAYVEDIEVGKCQRGGTWERILFILDRSHANYVIQVDADVLALAPLDEVVDAYKSNRSFTMPQEERGGQGMLDAAAFSRKQDDHITHCAEVAFERYPNAENLKYIRGSSGFAGFSKGGFTREQAEAFSQQISKLIGERWREWGSEQVMSNYAVANSPNAIALPFRSYHCFDPASGAVPASSKCLHFIGTIRYAKGSYAALGRRVIEELRRDA